MCLVSYLCIKEKGIKGKKKHKDIHNGAINKLSVEVFESSEVVQFIFHFNKHSVKPLRIA